MTGRRPAGPLTRALDAAVAATEWLAAALLVAMVVVVAAAVFYRYVLDDSLVWYDEGASFLLVWLTFVGSVVVAHRRRHISFELFVERRTPPVRRALEVAGELCVLAFQLVLVVYGWNLVEKMGDEPAASMLWLRLAWIYGVIPAAGLLMALVSLHRLAELLAGRPALEPRPASLDATE